MKTNMLLRCFHLVVFCFKLHTASSQCPPESSIAPCVCIGSSNQIAQLSCAGAVGLIRLTTILRNELCGSTIEKFELFNSDVEYLPSNLFFKNIVNDIQVSYTNISHFTRAGRSAFFGLEQHLSSLSMRRCRLVDQLQWQMIGELHVLTYLDLSYNDLTKIPQQWFEHPPPNLLSLILKGNKISSLESGALAYMHDLIRLDLSENQISVLHRNVFPNPGNALIFLSLSDNEIRSLPIDLFSEMMGLRRIYLNNNRLENLPEELWSPLWGDLEHLDLKGNPIQCECDALWVARLLSPKLLYGECQPDNDLFYNLTGKALRNLKLTDFDMCGY